MRSPINRLRSRTAPVVMVLSALVALVLASVTVGYASHTNAQIEGCVHNATGALRVVASPLDCKRAETAIHWNAQGPAGPAGGVPVNQSCPTGQVVTGIDAQGLLICTSAPTPGDDLDADGVSIANGDCDDADPAVFPGNEEVFDGKDNDCDGQVDEGLNNVDDDGDGWIEPFDCNDALATVHPGADEVAGDGIDNNCDGIIT